MQSVLTALALPQYGLSTVFVVSLISATLLPLGSEPVVFGLIKLNPEQFWLVVLVATAGNTLGGMISWWMGYEAHVLTSKAISKSTTSNEARALRWLHALGPKACLLSWLPGVGDPLCAVAGWIRLPFWPCVAYMTVGKLARYVLITGGLLWVFPNNFL